MKYHTAELWIGAALAFCLSCQTFAQADKGPVHIHILWGYENIPEGMHIYDLKPGNWSVWKTDVAARKEDAPISKEFVDSTIEAHRGEKKKFALVYTNAGDKPLYFFAAPHVVEPAQNALGFKFVCLCTNRVYKVPPHYTWYRIVEVKVARNFQGDHLDVRHRLIGVDAARGEQFQEGMREEMDHD